MKDWLQLMPSQELADGRVGGRRVLLHEAVSARQRLDLDRRVDAPDPAMRPGKEAVARLAVQEQHRTLHATECKPRVDRAFEDSSFQCWRTAQLDAGAVLGGAQRMLHEAAQGLVGPSFVDASALQPGEGRLRGVPAAAPPPGALGHRVSAQRAGQLHAQPGRRRDHDGVEQHDRLEQARVIRGQAQRQRAAETVSQADQRRPFQPLRRDDSAGALQYRLDAGEALRRVAVAMALDVIAEQAIVRQELAQQRPVHASAESVAVQEVDRRLAGGRVGAMCAPDRRRAGFADPSPQQVVRLSIERHKER